MNHISPATSASSWISHTLGFSDSSAQNLIWSKIPTKIAVEVRISFPLGKIQQNISDSDFQLGKWLGNSQLPTGTRVWHHANMTALTGTQWSFTFWYTECIPRPKFLQWQAMFAFILCNLVTGESYTS